MTAQEREDFINLIYNDYLYNIEGLTLLLKETNDAIMMMQKLRDQYGIVSEESVIYTKLQLEAMTKAWLLLHKK